MKLSVLLLSFTLALGAFAQDEVTLAFEYEDLKVKKGVELIDDTTYGVESVAVSNDGSKLCWIGKTTANKLVYPADIILKEKKDGQWQASTKHKKKLKKMNLFSKCSFNEKGQ